MASRNRTIEYWTTTKIGEQGQLTVPQQFREELGLGTDAPFAVLRLRDGLVLLPEQLRFDRLCEQAGAALTNAGANVEAVLATLPEARTLVFAQRYKNGGSRKKSSRREPGCRGDE
jgi:bifunctional DNA-binding transcriptional regulator/antitoxin component of YhaV-PrlF toxin-antitoxin module